MRVTISPDGSRVASCHSLGTICVSRFGDGRLGRSTHYSEGKTASRVVFSPSGEWVATVVTETSGAGNAEAVRVRDVTNGSALGCIRHDGKIAAVMFDPTHRLLASASRNGTVQIWDVASATAPLSIRFSDMPVGLAFSPDGQVLAVATFGTTLWVYDLDKGGDPERIVHEDKVRAVAFIRDGLLATITSDHLHVWRAS
jgi:WD40 repeat protein